MRTPRLFVVAAMAAGALAAVASAQERPAGGLAAPSGKPPLVQAPGHEKPSAPSVFGTTYISYITVSASEFSPLQSATAYSDDGVSSLAMHRYSTAPAGVFVATPHLPSGALVTYFEYDYCNTNASVGSEAYLYDLNYQGPVNTLLADLPVGGTGGCGDVTMDLTSANYTMYNFTNRLLVAIRTDGGDTTTSFAGAIIGYKLQVSPAPGTQTFLDVAPGDFGYQYIEALAASGITGGCGGGNYCPNGTLTRAQMAVFIAKALGLHWQ